MKRQNRPNRWRNTAAKVCGLFAVASALLGLVAAQSARAEGNKCRFVNPGVFPPDSHPYGKAYNEWAAAWEQWAFGIPVADNPVLDTTGTNAAVGQQGPVWFLAGVFGSNTVVRSCEVPVGKALFFPILNQFWFTGPYDVPPYTDPQLTVPEIRDLLAGVADTFSDMSCEVDGRPLRHLEAYREQSVVFDVTFPEDSVVTSPDWPIPAGTYGPCLDDGYYVMLAPLAPGHHTIHIHGTCGFWGTTLDVTYHLRVQPKCHR